MQLTDKVRKHYELPNCPICLDPLQKDLAIFSECGHVFHYLCAVNSNTTSRKCPNCRHRSMQVVQIHYTIEEIDEVEKKMQEMLQQMNSEDQIQLATIMIQYEKELMTNRQITQKMNIIQEQNQKTMNENKKLLERNSLLEEKLKNYEISKSHLIQQNDILEIDIKHKKDEIQKQSERIRQLDEMVSKFKYLEELQTKMFHSSNEQDKYVLQVRQMPFQEQVSKFIYILSKCNRLFDIYQVTNGKYKDLLIQCEELERLKSKWDKQLAQQKSIIEDRDKEINNLRRLIKKNKIHKTSEMENSNENSVDLRSQFKTNEINQQISQINSSNISTQNHFLHPDLFQQRKKEQFTQKSTIGQDPYNLQNLKKPKIGIPLQFGSNNLLSKRLGSFANSIYKKE